MNILCVIPVRGGSKGIPLKNVRNLGGKPLMAWTVEQAVNAKIGLDVVVSTDDEEMADVARRYGADVPFMRPAELAEDTTATEPVVAHAINFRTAQGRKPDAVVLLQVTSPLRHPDTLDRAVNQFLETGVDSLVGVVPTPPFLWRLGNEAAGTPVSAEYDYENRPRRQELTPEQIPYRENGSLYVSKPELYLGHNNRLGGKIGLFILDELEGVDIDTELDFALAEQQIASLGKGL